MTGNGEDPRGLRGTSRAWGTVSPTFDALSDDGDGAQGNEPQTPIAPEPLSTRPATADELGSTRSEGETPSPRGSPGRGEYVRLRRIGADVVARDLSARHRIARIYARLANGICHGWARRGWRREGARCM